METEFLANMIQIIGLPILILQILYAIIIYRDDHERSRRENAVKYLSEFTKTIDRKSSIARKLMERFTNQQCHSLAKQEIFKVDSKYKDEVKAIFDLADDKINISGDMLIIDQEQSAQLRWLAMTYLNSIETVLLTWRHNVADRKMIEEECENLVDDTQGYTILEELRKVFGKEACPAIEDFVIATREKRAIKPGKQPTGHA